MTTALDVGYLLIEPLAQEKGSHNGGSATASVGAPLGDWVSVGLSLHGVLMTHPDDQMGADDSGTGFPVLAVRVLDTRQALSYGIELEGVFPGRDAPSIDFAATTLRATGMATYAPVGSSCAYAYVMVLEYVHGYDLGHWLKFLRGKARRLPIDVALEIAVRVLEALHYAHTQKKPDGSPGGVIHRDISPSNILLDLDGSVRILDFGIAQVTDELADADTKRNLFKGKIGYSHPSLLKLGTPSAITDTYSAAVVVLQMLIGVNPFYAESTAATMERVINMPLPKLRDFRSDASTELERILLRALSRDLTEAFPSALALAEALKTQRNNDASHAANQLNEMVQSDFVGEMPQVLQLERLDERDARLTGSFDTFRVCLGANAWIRRRADRGRRLGNGRYDCHGCYRELSRPVHR